MKCVYIQTEFSHASAQVSQSGLDAVCSDYENVAWPVFPWDANAESSLWDYQKSLLLEEFPCKGGLAEWVCDLLQLYIALERGYAARIFKSKKRDDQRGASTIPGYKASHFAAEGDPVIKEARKAAEAVESTANLLVGKMKRYYRSKL